MKLTIKKKQLDLAPEMWLRRAGYVLLPANQDGQISFSRRLSRDFYPRFHIYFNLGSDSAGEEIITFNLHLDQKRPGYAGQKRHNAEYDGEVVEQELARLKSLLLPDFFV